MKLLAIDLDQTLLHTDKLVSDFTKNVFAKLDNRDDIKVIVATGRSYLRANNYVEAIKADGIISLNGAKTSYHSKIVSEYPVDETNAKDLIESLLKLPDTYVNITYPDVILTNNETLVTGDHVHEYTNYSLINTKEIQKISLVTRHPELILNFDTSPYHCKLITAKNNPTYFVLLNEKVSKLTGLEDLCRHLNITLKDVIAFGDDYNDLDLLMNAGQAIVVDNGAPEIKQYATTICESNDQDGVAKWIAQHILNE
ncbi:Cof-type HAD-IIB family hydrolase [Anaerorhabdus furcosa]|uniref:Cof subfamily of IIB subfamily of haloacid dehalogenase superfamily/HAD-superfamily hydrolase, subfamily IIB n=1 Tax=Anaerorhabdus furcosa TaxID=118967 RepID=A0A1T4NG66_9FIRM|nr:Cof-type HAD-IIB family hydrolase [Anaerorhabdus furcosa]SJZ78046.1 Cof subfamily of IIB subfamily of haloacid dehalogenase superfamily/HAD-superfamily hydrolase, subfamily IIB [Anaerorhabdus furcosa]